MSPGKDGQDPEGGWATAQGAEEEASPDGCGDGEEGRARQQASTGHHLHLHPLGEQGKCLKPCPPRGFTLLCGQSPNHWRRE